jgi:hypothetical protein
MEDFILVHVLIYKCLFNDVLSVTQIIVSKEKTIGT